MASSLEIYMLNTYAPETIHITMGDNHVHDLNTVTKSFSPKCTLNKHPYKL